MKKYIEPRIVVIPLNAEDVLTDSTPGSIIPDKGFNGYEDTFQ